jgi:hypothetical protein
MIEVTINDTAYHVYFVHGSEPVSFYQNGSPQQTTRRYTEAVLATGTPTTPRKEMTELARSRAATHSTDRFEKKKGRQASFRKLISETLSSMEGRETLIPLMVAKFSQLSAPAGNE